MLKADFKGPYTTGREYDQLSDGGEYFLLFNEQNAQKVKLNKRSFFKLITTNQKKVEDFVKATNVDLDTEAGWIKALAYYETL